MRILIVTQVFFPDTVSVSQHLSDIAFELTQNGHSVTVFTSKYGYENKKIRFKSKEIISGVEIFRLSQSTFGKSNIISRLLDFFTFDLSLIYKLINIKNNEYDIVFGSTNPPLLSFLSIIISKFKCIKFYYWVMDLQPELSISSGLIKKNSLLAKLLTFFGNYIINNSDKIISLDRFMTKYILSRGANVNNINTIPVWPVVSNLIDFNNQSNPFRIDNNFGNKIIIMYSGNHAYVHPLNTLLNLSLLLKNDQRFLFVFIGGGVRKKDVSNFKVSNSLSNIIQLPFQPRENLQNSLSAADLHVVIIGDGQVGYTHPNKIYGAIFIGKPIIYIGPKESHVTDILNQLPDNICVEHNQTDLLLIKILEFASKTENEIKKIGINNYHFANKHFNPNTLKSKLVDVLKN
jgi:colanic acid biosynthesis glycosyl transferase WcaI